MDAELAKLLDAAGLSKEDREKAEAAFNIEGLSKAVKDGVMMRSDYSRKQDELTKQRKELEAKWNAANAEYIEMQITLDSTQAEKDAAAANLADAEAKLAEAQKNQIDPSKFLSAEEFDKRQKQIVAGQAAYFGDVLEIVADHQQLFGARLSPRQLMQDCIAASKTPMDYWNEKYNVPAKREEIAKADEAKKLTDAENKGYQKRIAEEANPATRQPRASENPFYVKDAPEGKQPWDEVGTPESEKALLKELQAARA
jgi:hypothetical protein